jgi:D-alanyl-D-alanine carboxypeptidase
MTPSSLAAAVALAGTLLWSLPPVPMTAIDAGEAPEIGAAAWILYDDTNDVLLSEHLADQELPMASVTKLMTALVVVDHADVDEVVIISETAAATGEAEIGIVAGELWTVGDLLAAVMVRSGNDAAVALAERVGGSIPGFAAMMNDKAAALGLEHSRFVNPHGLDADGHYSSARDLLVIAQAVLDNPAIARLARTKVVKFRDDPAGVKRRAINTNALLGAYPGVIGMKTGYTGEAGRVLVAAADQEGRRLISVVMGSEDHFFDTRELLAWGFDTFGLGDRWTDLFLEPFGGGGLGLLPELVSTEVEQRLRAMPQLPETSGQRRLTPLEERIEQFLRSAAPTILGGSGG